MLTTVYKAAVNSDEIATIVPELHHENQTHSSDQASEEAFERGYRDGLHNPHMTISTGLPRTWKATSQA